MKDSCEVTKEEIRDLQHKLDEDICRAYDRIEAAQKVITKLADAVEALGIEAPELQEHEKALRYAQGDLNVALEDLQYHNVFYKFYD